MIKFTAKKILPTSSSSNYLRIVMHRVHYAPSLFIVMCYVQGKPILCTMFIAHPLQVQVHLHTPAHHCPSDAFLWQTKRTFFAHGFSKQRRGVKQWSRDISIYIRSSLNKKMYFSWVHMFISGSNCILCIISKNVSNFSFLTEVYSNKHWPHLWIFSVCMWFFRQINFDEAGSYLLHLNALFPLWILMCCFWFPTQGDAKLHLLHLWVLSLICVCKVTLFAFMTFIHFITYSPWFIRGKGKIKWNAS